MLILVILLKGCIAFAFGVLIGLSADRIAGNLEPGIEGAVSWMLATLIALAILLGALA